MNYFIGIVFLGHVDKIVEIFVGKNRYRENKRTLNNTRIYRGNSKIGEKTTAVV
jgi:hypothetical protein